MSTSRPQTILFADVSGSTRLFEVKGDVEARRLIARVLDALSAICRENGGRVIKTIGDEIMCTFPGALNGVLAACDMQRRMGRDPEFVRDSLAVRIGLHHGDALEEQDGDVYGDAVNTAARMASLAKREQGLADFDDLITLAGSLLRVGSFGEWVRFKLDQRTDHILVDEAQDTNMRQWGIVLSLAEEFFAVHGDDAEGQVAIGNRLIAGLRNLEAKFLLVWPGQNRFRQV